MKKIFLVLCLFFLSSVSTFASIEQDENAADFLATTGIIETSSDYKLDSTITRREMLKVMMNLSGKPISDICTGKFQDLPSTDWGCKYAEAALTNGYISANTNFRPDDNVTNVEGLKMVMQARNIPKATENYPCSEGENCTITDWKSQYTVGANEYNLLGNGGEYSFYTEKYDPLKYSMRKDIFLISARTMDEFTQNTLYWRKYSSDRLSFSYPENWLYFDMGENFSIYSKNIINREKITIHFANNNEITYQNSSIMSTFIKNSLVIHPISYEF